MAKLERMECVPTSLAVKPNLFCPIDASVVCMWWRISFCVMKCVGESGVVLNVFTGQSTRAFL